MRCHQLRARGLGSLVHTGAARASGETILTVRHNPHVLRSGDCDILFLTSFNFLFKNTQVFLKDLFLYFSEKLEFLFCSKNKIYLFLLFSRSPSHVQLLGTPWTVAHQAPLSVGFSRQEYRSGHFLLQGIFPTQGSSLTLLHLLHRQAVSLPLALLGSPSLLHYYQATDYFQEENV